MKLTGKMWCALIAGGIALVLLGAGIATVLQPKAAPVSPSPAAPSEPASSPEPAVPTPEPPPAPEPAPTPELASSPESGPPAPPTPSVPETDPSLPPVPEVSGGTAPSAPAAGDIGMEAAKSTALLRAGVTSDQVTWKETKTDRDHGRIEYELEFRVGQMEYEYDINGADGQILKEHWENHGATTAAGDIGEASAKAAALAYAGLSEDQLSRLRVERDRDHGQVEYEIEFLFGQLEYDCTVNGDGTIVKFGWEIH